jgi:crotonobetainyl-CoA:carnitine CoA-transferase CaiB-like acyl-CoA transferase
MERHTSDWWLQTLKANDIPAVKVQTPQDLLHDRHLLDTGFIRRDPHPTEGTVVGFESPMRFGRSPAQLTRLAPNLGEHSAEILAELGYNQSDIDAFSGRGIIKQFSA